MLALNAGSSSIKFGLFDITGAEPSYLFAGEVADIGDKPHLTIKDMDGRSVHDRGWPTPRKQEDILHDILGWADRNAGNGGLGRDRTSHRAWRIAVCCAGAVES